MKQGSLERGFKFKILLVKKYFDIGYGLTNYFFKALAVFGLSTNMAKETIIVLTLYTLSLYFIGRFYVKYKFLDVENEVNNKFNPYVRQMRKKFGIPNNRNI